MTGEGGGRSVDGNEGWGTYPRTPGRGYNAQRESGMGRPATSTGDFCMDHDRGGAHIHTGRPGTARVGAKAGLLPKEIPIGCGTPAPWRSSGARPDESIADDIAGCADILIGSVFHSPLSA